MVFIIKLPELTKIVIMYRSKCHVLLTQQVLVDLFFLYLIVRVVQYELVEDLFVVQDTVHFLVHVQFQFYK